MDPDAWRRPLSQECGRNIMTAKSRVFLVSSEVEEKAVVLPEAESRAEQDRWVSFSVCEHFCACMCVIFHWGKWPLKPCCLGDQQQIETSGISGPQLDAPCQTRTGFVGVVEP